MNHVNERNVICPHCGYIENNFNGLYGSPVFDGEYICQGCIRPFILKSNVSVTYNTTVISCAENGEGHEYELKIVFKKNGVYYEKIVCKKCFDETEVVISEAEYDRLAYGRTEDD